MKEKCKKNGKYVQSPLSHHSIVDEDFQQRCDGDRNWEGDFFFGKVGETTGKITAIYLRETV
jgi:hypothetical protein